MSTPKKIYIIHTCHGEPIGLLARETLVGASVALAESGWLNCDRRSVHAALGVHVGQITARDLYDKSAGSFSAGSISSRARIGPDLYVMVEWAL